ncbi:hypothetical protein PVAND_007361 [Polypedilum vanderplanki]|uniref:Mediator of RNA polymerase II transcription subunit 30 n=1 Tax=Polypedilum vanderplanki TaxID=319348 RepID=A0A9J6C727_POLVA|nr:hypothetical protein PVAND_007361 [Polypedilum vanderplanki]
MDFQNQIAPSNQQQQNQSQIPQLSLQTPQTPNQTIAGANINPQQKELNVLTLCRIGQETVQDILSRFQDVFSILKNHQPPNGTQGSGIISADKRQKMQDQFRTIRLLFKRLRLLYEKCENSEEYIEIENLIPYVDNPNTLDPMSNADEYEKALAENRELNEVLKEKNLQLKEIIDRIRIIVSEINTMMSARRC